MKSNPNKTSSLKKSVLAIAMASISSATLGAITFTEIPNDNWGGSIAVSDNGTVVFAGDHTVYKWSKTDGLVALNSVEWGRVANANISDDGSVIAFTSVALTSPYQSNGTLVYTDGVERVIDLTTINTSAFMFPGRMSPDGKYLTGMLNNNPAYMNLEDDTVTEIPDIPGENLISMADMSDNGTQRFIKAQNGYTPDAYFQEGDGELEYVDLLYSAAISANGQLILGEKANCTEVTTLGANLCTAVWDKDTKEITEIGYFRPTSISRDGTIVTGNGWSDAPGAKVWDLYNGTRDIQDILTANGIDVSGWSGFGSLSVSSDGSKIAGYATNPQGIKRPFLIDIIPECIGF